MSQPMVGQFSLMNFPPASLLTQHLTEILLFLVEPLRMMEHLMQLIALFWRILPIQAELSTLVPEVAPIIVETRS
jgi:hypothetical protein